MKAELESLGFEKRKKVVKNKVPAPLSTLKELPFLIISAVLIAWVVKSFIIQPFYIPSESMVPTLIIDDRILVEKMTYRFREPKSGEIVVFEPPVESQYPWVKRVIAVGGQTLELRRGELYIDGKKKAEPYLKGRKDYSNLKPVKVKEGFFYYMGDNRVNSSDSRIFGPIEVKRIKGRMVCVYWPLKSIKLF